MFQIIIIESPDTGYLPSPVCNRKRLYLLPRWIPDTCPPIPAGRLPRGELLDIAFVFAKIARKYLKPVHEPQRIAAHESACGGRTLTGVPYTAANHLM